MFYTHEKYISKRHISDNVLVEGALEWFKSKDASLVDRLTVLTVVGGMTAKVKLGIGLTKPTIRKTLEKLKTTTENTLRNIQNRIYLLQGHNLHYKPISSSSFRRWLSQQQWNTNSKSTKKRDRTSNNTVNNNFANLQMETETNRKRKFAEIKIDFNKSPVNKKSKLLIKHKNKFG